MSLLSASSFAQELLEASSKIYSSRVAFEFVHLFR